MPSPNGTYQLGDQEPVDQSDYTGELPEKVFEIDPWGEFGEDCVVIHAFSLVLETALGLDDDLITKLDAIVGEAAFRVWGVASVESESDEAQTMFHVATYSGSDSDKPAYMVVYALADMVSSGLLSEASFIVFGPQVYFDEHFHESPEGAPILENLFKELSDAHPDTWGRAN